MDNRRLLRASDLDGGEEDQFYWLDTGSGEVVPAPKATLDPGGVVSALEGSARVRLAKGAEVEVRPVMTLLREMLDRDYTPERIEKLCGIHPDTTRMLARKVAAKRTRFLMGWNSGKYYHGDLMERSMSLLLGLTGNWGKHGTGLRSWAVGLNDGMYSVMMKQGSGPDSVGGTTELRDNIAASIQQQDPSLTDEMVGYKIEQLMTQTMGLFTPPAFFWYHHCGYREVWNKAEYSDPAMKRTFDE